LPELMPEPANSMGLKPARANALLDSCRHAGGRFSRRGTHLNPRKLALFYCALGGQAFQADLDAFSRMVFRTWVGLAWRMRIIT
jgi:hypothetical protein